LLLDIPPLDPKLPSSIEATVLALCNSLRESAAAGVPALETLERDIALLKDSGLLSLVVPAQFGGKGASWGTALDIVRRVAKADSLTAERLACQGLQIATIQWLGSSEQQGELLFGTANGDWLWGGIVHASNTGVRASLVAGGVEISGIPGVHVALAGADRLLVAAQLEGGSGTVLATVDAARAGIVQRSERTAGAGEDSLRIELRRLQVGFDECLGGVLTTIPVAVTLRPLLEQLGLVHLYLGVCQGALDDLVLASRSGRRTPLKGRGDDADLSPHMLQRYADLWVDLKAATALTRSATHAFEDAWSEGAVLRPAERGRLALEIGEARQLASRAGAQVTQAVFEAMSAPAVHALRFDGWWRRLRANSMHDPIDFKRREIGRWILTGDLPRASLYS